MIAAALGSKKYVCEYALLLTYRRFAGHCYQTLRSKNKKAGHRLDVNVPLRCGKFAQNQNHYNTVGILNIIQYCSRVLVLVLVRILVLM